MPIIAAASAPPVAARAPPPGVGLADAAWSRKRSRDSSRRLIGDGLYGGCRIWARFILQDASAAARATIAARILRAAHPRRGTGAAGRVPRARAARGAPGRPHRRARGLS